MGPGKVVCNLQFLSYKLLTLLLSVITWNWLLIDCLKQFIQPSTTLTLNVVSFPTC